ncbi:hypothetical protein GGF32_008436 [Allomyces javanicus]|nr:hypothetical protein GGF32_008436 [Allomyces javanicus]
MAVCSAALRPRRWLGRTVLDVITAEFSRLKDEDVVKRMILAGHVTVNGMPTTAATCLADHDTLQTVVLRHEPDVVATTPTVVFEDKDILAIDKPGSVPVDQALGSVLRPTMADPKEASTKIVVRFRTTIDGHDMTVVQCTPRHGRMHQIRQHLASIGHPIINDTLYQPDLTRYAPYSSRADAIGDASLWPVPDTMPGETMQLPALPGVERGRIMAIDLRAVRYAFPTLGFEFAVPDPKWALE